MKIPKKIDKLLDRAKLALELMCVNHELDSWLESKGGDLTDPEITDSTVSGCMIYCEPHNANEQVRRYIEKRL